MESRTVGHHPETAMRALSLEADSPLSFAEIYEEAFPWVWRTARRLGVRDSALDDVAQDVFVIVHRKLATLDGHASLRPWVYGITLRVVRDRRRSARRHPEHPADDDELANLRSEGADPQTNALRREALGALLTVLDSLNDEQREVFVLAELEELSAPEIAEATATNVNTVYSRLRAARKAFEAGAARLRAREQFITEKGSTR
jgi:RNA polymerase sigma-70 factor (ECF subfamily)